MKRRDFLKTAAVTSVSTASSPGIFFPKPATAYTSLNYVLSMDARSDVVFNNFLVANVARGTSEKLPPETDSAVIAAVNEIEGKLVKRAYVENKTPYSKRLGNINQPLWGQQKQEDLGPDPGFGTVQVVRNRFSAISFTGVTTAGIDKSITVLGTDENLNPEQLDGILIPTQARYEDWATWRGEVDPETGEFLQPNSTTRYRTRYGEVTRFYRIEKPGKDGFGIIDFFIDAPRIYNGNLSIKVEFS